MEDKGLLLGRMEDLAAKAVKTGFAASKFLTPAERQTVSAYFSCRHDVTLAINGGFEGAERTRAVFTNPDCGGYSRAELFTALKISHRPQGHIGAP